MRIDKWYTSSYLKRNRKLRRRQILTNVTYHTMSRCIDKKNYMNSDKIKNLFIFILELAQKKYDFELNDYVIMDNHFHLKITITNEKDPINLIMQFIKAQFARRFNKMFNRTGPFWNERYKDSIIEHAKNPSEYSNYLIWYFAYNPQKAGIINNIYDYKFCCINFYFNMSFKSKLKLTYDKYFIELGVNYLERIEKFKKYEKMCNT